MYPVGEDLTMKFFAEHVPHPRVPVAHVCPCETESHDFPAVIARQVELEAVTSFRRAPAVSRDVLGHLVEVPPGIVADGYHLLSTKLTPEHFPNTRNFMNGIMWKNTRDISFGKLVVWDGIGKVESKMTFDIEHIIVPEVLGYEPKR